MKRADRLLEEIKSNQQFHAEYTAVMSSLYRSGLLEFLRSVGTPLFVGRGSDPHALAAQAAWSIGFNQCLDFIIDFQHIFLDSAPKDINAIMDFGALNIAVERGHMTKEEADALRNKRTK